MISVFRWKDRRRVIWEKNDRERIAELETSKRIARREFPFRAGGLGKKYRNFSTASPLSIANSGIFWVMKGREEWRLVS